jgi:hypothetical protein
LGFLVSKYFIIQYSLVSHLRSYFMVRISCAKICMRNWNFFRFYSEVIDIDLLKISLKFLGITYSFPNDFYVLENMELSH